MRRRGGLTLHKRRARSHYEQREESRSRTTVSLHHRPTISRSLHRAKPGHRDSTAQRRYRLFAPTPEGRQLGAGTP